MPDGAWRVTGHKWFFSAPQCDAHLVLAQTPPGFGCFLLPRIDPDGTPQCDPHQPAEGQARQPLERIGRGRIRARARHGRSAKPGRGIATILEMVQHTRLDCVIGSAGIMRAALTRALHHARHRTTFGRRLADQPLMAQRARRSRARKRSGDARWRCAWRARARPAPKPALRTRCAHHHAGREILGLQARDRGSPPKRWKCSAATATSRRTRCRACTAKRRVNSIWEGSGNIVCLDVARAARREPGSVAALLADVASVRGANAHFDRHCAALERLLRSTDDHAAEGRRVAQAVALAVSAAN